MEKGKNFTVEKTGNREIDELLVKLAAAVEKSGKPLKAVDVADSNTKPSFFGLAQNCCN